MRRRGSGENQQESKAVFTPLAFQTCMRWERTTGSSSSEWENLLLPQIENHMCIIYATRNVYFYGAGVTCVVLFASKLLRPTWCFPSHFLVYLCIICSLLKRWNLWYCIILDHSYDLWIGNVRWSRGIFGPTLFLNWTLCICILERKWWRCGFIAGWIGWFYSPQKHLSARQALKFDCSKKL